MICRASWVRWSWLGLGTCRPDSLAVLRRSGAWSAQDPCPRSERPRFRAPSVIWIGHWIPACAGMTCLCLSWAPYAGPCHGGASSQAPETAKPAVDASRRRAYSYQISVGLWPDTLPPSTCITVRISVRTHCGRGPCVQALGNGSGCEGNGGHFSKFPGFIN